MTVKDGHDHTPVEEHHPSPLPPYLRQSSRTHSTSSVQTTSSTRSRPHAQNEYIPTSTGITTVFGTAEPTLETDIENRHIPESDEEEGGSDEGSELDWDAIRDQSTSDKPAWRRPRPAWIYPFMFGTAFTLGMSSAPKAELFINLTCLVHPPRQPSSVVTATLDVSSIDRSDGVYVDRYNELDVITQVPINASLPDTTLPSDPTIGGPIPRSAADKWFYKLQKDIYDWNLAHPDSHDHERPSHTSAATTSTASRELPTGPLPQPTLSPDRPAPPSTPPTKEPHQGSEHPPFHAIDPTLCKKDPGVQAAAAKLTMTLTVTLGLLSALTTGYWGKMSDKLGRTKILAIVELGLFINELAFILVATFPYLAPGGYRSLLIGPIFDGSLGGVACLIATTHAYVSDLTPDGSRAAAFSRLMGILMSGFAFGPMIGAFLIRATDDIMVPFYVDAVVHGLWPILILLLLPESLSKEARAHLAKQSAKTAEAARRKDALQREWENERSRGPGEDEASASGWSRISHAGHSRRRRRFMGSVARLSKRLFHFLEPLTVFSPQERVDGVRGKDWNLALIAFAIFAEAMNFGVMTVKAQFTMYNFGWTTAQLGPFMSLAGFSRGFVLIVLLPLVMRYIRPRYTATPPCEPSSTHPTLPPTGTPPSSRLDLLTARSSLIIETTGLFLLALNFPAPTFVLISVLLTLGAGTSPALNSLALALLPDKSATGRLFGALSVIHALGSSLLGPIVFGELFATTVGIYAPTVFAVAAFLPAIGLLALTFVKLDRGVQLGDERGVEAVEQGQKKIRRSASPRV